MKHDIKCIDMPQVLPENGHLVSLEKDLSWVLVGKRFLWQASQGSRNKQSKPKGDKVSQLVAAFGLARRSVVVPWHVIEETVASIFACQAFCRTPAR